MLDTTVEVRVDVTVVATVSVLGEPYIGTLSQLFFVEASYAKGTLPLS